MIQKSTAIEYNRGNSTLNIQHSSISKSLNSSMPTSYKRIPMTNSFINTLFHMCRSKKSHDRFFIDTGNDVICTKENKDEVEAVVRNAYKCGLNRIADMYIAYNKALFTKNLFPNPEIFDDYDFIDISNINLAFQNIDAIKFSTDACAYVDESGIYGYIPCFSKFVMKVASSTYAVIHVNKIDIEEGKLNLGVFTYQNEDDEIITPMAIFNVEYSFHFTDDGNTYDVNLISDYSLTSIFKAISPKQMKWNESDRKAWASSIVKFAKLVDNASDQKNCIAEYAMEISDDLICMFMYINYLLHINKKKYSPRTNRNKKATIEKSFDKEKQREKKLYVLDNFISISSYEPPQEMTRKTVIKYHLASWSVKGHLRHYKNGKVVYIKPHIKHRKGMGEDSENVTPRTQKLILNDTFGDKIS